MLHKKTHRTGKTTFIPSTQRRRNVWENTPFHNHGFHALREFLRGCLGDSYFIGLAKGVTCFSYNTTTTCSLRKKAKHLLLILPFFFFKLVNFCWKCVSMRNIYDFGAWILVNFVGGTIFCTKRYPKTDFTFRLLAMCCIHMVKIRWVTFV